MPTGSPPIVGDAGASYGTPFDGSLEEDVGVASASAASTAAFFAACNTFAPSFGKASCETCINEASVMCDNDWSQLREQCQVAYLCGTGCLCTAPCGTNDLCACVAGCLTLGDSPCKELWTEVMRCIGSVCADHC